LKVRAQVAALAAAACCLSIVLPAQQPASALPYTVISREARRPLAVRVVGGQEMFALDDLARLFSLTVREDTAAGALTVASGAQTIVLSPQQPLASVAGRMISLPAAPVRDGRAWYVPVDFVSRALAPGSTTRIELRKPSRLLLTGDIRMPRVAARVEPLGSLTRVTIDVAPATPHSVAQDGSRLLVRFEADALDAADLRVPAPTDVLQAIHLADVPHTIALDLGPRFASFRASDLSAPAGGGRIVIDLIAHTETAPPPGTSPAPQPGQPPPGEIPPLLDMPPAGGLRTVVIDPGHGGDDSGARSAQGDNWKAQPSMEACGSCHDDVDWTRPYIQNGQTMAAKGSYENPLTRAEEEEKALDLLAPVLGKTRSQALLKALWNFEQLEDVRELRQGMP